MKKSFSRDLAIEVIAVSEDVMSFEDAQKFAAEKATRAGCTFLMVASARARRGSGSLSKV